MPAKKKSLKKPVRKAVRRPKPAARKKPVKTKAKAKPTKPKKKVLIGTIRHFFPNISVAVVDLSGDMKKGDKILIEGSTTSFTQRVDSMQVEHRNIAVAKKGQAIGLKVKDKAREGDSIYLVK